MRFLLIPAADGLPAVQGHLARWPGEDDRPSAEELRERVEPTHRFVWVADLLIEYAKRLRRPSCN